MKQEGLAPDDGRRRLWVSQWGSGYAPDFKRAEVAPILKQMESKGSLGNVLLDAGSGSLDRGESYYPLEGKRVVRIDIGMPYPHRIRGNVLELQADVEDKSPGSIRQLRRLLMISRHLGIDPRIQPLEFDTIILIDILNYVDFRETISSLLPFLRQDGRMFISNMPGMGIQGALSERGVQSNYELLSHIRVCGMIIEHLAQPPQLPRWMIHGKAQSDYPSIQEGKANDKGSLILVSQKV
jgi:hypothetical protein